MAGLVPPCIGVGMDFLVVGTVALAEAGTVAPAEVGMDTLAEVGN